ncbi:uncharacterized protein B0H64DRAFT_467447 [Chaetomium fimeti]|uniref:Uncharacterized protein n=1 Tax=Chaetomium fimeti TaxID=1854472 RepID=A0AAE0H9H9_9PEZI|nr:hypothetical protein B0H64DRAFT_467447 [Chaetomium fimeti]
MAVITHHPEPISICTTQEDGLTLLKEQHPNPDTDGYETDSSQPPLSPISPSSTTGDSFLTPPYLPDLTNALPTSPLPSDSEEEEQEVPTPWIIGPTDPRYLPTLIGIAQRDITRLTLYAEEMLDTQPAHAARRRGQQRRLAALNLDPASADRLVGVEREEEAAMQGVVDNLWYLVDMQKMLDELDQLRLCPVRGAGAGAGGREGEGDDKGDDREYGEKRLAEDVLGVIDRLRAVGDWLEAVQTWREENVLWREKNWFY